MATFAEYEILEELHRGPLGSVLRGRLPGQARDFAIKVFDPACGSGNFLVIAYKELRRLEHAILERLAELDVKHQVLYAESKINIENFYGIELDDFAVEVAILALWIAKHQMNAEFKEKFNLKLLQPAKPNAKGPTVMAPESLAEIIPQSSPVRTPARWARSCRTATPPSSRTESHRS